MNHVALTGRLTRDVEVQEVGGSTLAKFAVANNRKYKTKSGEDRDEATFVECEVWGRLAETISRYFSRGDPILLEGRLKFESWEGRDGTKKSRLVLSVLTFEFMGPKAPEKKTKKTNASVGVGDFK